MLEPDPTTYLILASLLAEADETGLSFVLSKKKPRQVLFVGLVLNDASTLVGH